MWKKPENLISTHQYVMICNGICWAWKEYMLFDGYYSAIVKKTFIRTMNWYTAYLKKFRFYSAVVTIHLANTKSVKQIKSVSQSITSKPKNNPIITSFNFYFLIYFWVNLSEMLVSVLKIIAPFSLMPKIYAKTKVKRNWIWKLNFRNCDGVRLRRKIVTMQERQTRKKMNDH